MGPGEQIREVVEAYLAAVSAGDADAGAALFAEGALIFDPVGETAAEGPEGVHALFADRAARYSLFERQLGVLYVRDDGAAFTWTGRARRTPEPTVELSGIDVIEVDQMGLLRTVWSYWDPGSLDVETPPDTAANEANREQQKETTT